MPRAPTANVAEEIDRINTFFPLLPALGNRWALARPWEGRCVAINAHLTTLTAALLRELVLGGGRWVVSAAHAATTDQGVVDYLRDLGVSVYPEGGRRDRHLAALDHEPDLISDVGFGLLETLLDRRRAQIREVVAAVEITRSGVIRMRDRARLPLPVVNINDGRLKPHVENRNGVGEGLWDAARDITGMHMSGRRAAVVGYGPVGQGIARYGRAAGAVVEVVEIDPVRRLVAHYDGFPTPDLAQALATAELVVTATGHAGAVPIEALQQARSGLVLINAGHGGDEIAIEDLPGIAEKTVVIGKLCRRYKLPDGGPWLTVLADGHPLNIVTNSGSPEPVLLHFAVLGLTLAWLAGADLLPGEHLVPAELESEAATRALQALQGRR